MRGPLVITWILFAGTAFCGETSPLLATRGEVGKSPHQVFSSGTEEGVHNTERQRLKVEKDSKAAAKTAQASITSSSASPFSSSSMSSAPTPSSFVLQASQCSMTKASQQPPIVYLPKLVYDIVTSADSTGLPKSASLLPYHSVMWASSFRPLMSKMMTCTEQSLYYRQWTVPKPIHMDYNNRNEGRMDTFHPRRLLLSGPPQVCNKRRVITLTISFELILPHCLIDVEEWPCHVKPKVPSQSAFCFQQPQCSCLEAHKQINPQSLSQYLIRDSCDREDSMLGIVMTN